MFTSTFSFSAFSSFLRFLLSYLPLLFLSHRLLSTSIKVCPLEPAFTVFHSFHKLIGKFIDQSFMQGRIQPLLAPEK